ncbi:MAG: hypothetical protein AAGD32_00025 [Planctomycetota bacterium]
MGQIYPIPFWREMSFKGWHWLIAPVLIAFGCGWFWLSTGPTVAEWWQQRAWVEAELVDVDLRIDERKGPKSRVHYDIVGSFTYVHDGTVHRGERLGLTSPSRQSRAAAEARREVLESRTTCVVDPVAPGRALLEPGWNRESWYVISGLASLGIGIGMLVTGFLTRPRRSTQHFRWIAGAERTASAAWAGTLFAAVLPLAVAVCFSLDGVADTYQLLMWSLPASSSP